MKSKKQNLSDKILGHFDKKQRKINTLENENDTLKTAIKDELYILFMNKLREPTENVRLKKENKRLRLQVKSLKEIIKGN